MVVGVGRFGPYVRYKGKFYSLKKGTDDPYSVTAERAISIINEKDENDRNKTIKDFGDIMVLNGRYGPYITMDKKNYKLPKGTDPEKLTREECVNIIAAGDKTKKKS